MNIKKTVVRSVWISDSISKQKIHPMKWHHYIGQEKKLRTHIGSNVMVINLWTTAKISKRREKNIYNDHDIIQYSAKFNIQHFKIIALLIGERGIIPQIFKDFWKE